MFLKVIKDKGIWITILLSAVVLITFYGKILKHPNQVYFSNSGDGLQSYYTTLYHIKYDSSYSHFQGMNYPYGEQVLFTNCQPPISNTIKFISRNIIDISDYTIGIINLMMLLSIVIAAVFLYLILKEFNLGWIYSVFIAVGIAYLSPLINRFPGHYSLSYVFTIPVVIYLLIKFYKNPSWEKSLVTGLFILLMATFHMYNFAFAAFILGIFWIIQLISDKKYRKWKFAMLNISLQIILPILVINVWLWLTDSVNDRTSYPWGFLEYKSGWEGIFLSDFKVDAPFLKSFIHARQIEWEGWAYIGHLPAYLFLLLFTIWGCIPFFAINNFGFFLILFLSGVIIHILLKKRLNLFTITDNKLLNIFLWTGFLAMLFSFAWPFAFSHGLLHYAGPLRQFRGIARFSWIFFYTINIGVFYYIYRLKINYKFLKYAMLVLSVVVLYYDAYQNNKNMQGGLNNSIPILNDKQNITLENQWVSLIESKKYQSIIPLPFFHVGSENIWIDPKCQSMYNAFIVSLKTGLPMNAVLMSRTSISQTYDNIQLVLEPYHTFDSKILRVSQKPFLLVVSECEEISRNEKVLISKSEFITNSENFSLFELRAETLKILSDSLFENSEKEIRSKKLFKIDNILSSDSLKRFIYMNYNDNINNKAYNGKGCYTGNIRKYNAIFEGSIPNALTDTDYVLSFWFGKIYHDVFPRTTVEITYCDSSGKVYNADYRSVQNLLKTIDNDWMLADFNFRLKNEKDKIKITLWNDDLSDSDTLYVDDLMIRPALVNTYYEQPRQYVMKNDRFYKCPTK
ncbi:MAG: hypothetical protein WC599_04380 [Bacteroidales bacterium]